MKKALLAALLAALMLVCTGCASFLERDYSVVQPHSSTYYESEDRSVLRAESYQDLVNDLIPRAGSCLWKRNIEPPVTLRLLKGLLHTVWGSSPFAL